MFYTFIKHSLKLYKRQKVYFLINVLGLALGLACSMLITTFVLHELSFDKFNANKDRIYKLILNGKTGEQEVLVTSTASVIAPTMKRDFPEVETFCRISKQGALNLKYGDRDFEEKSILEADSSFFEVFSIPLLHGNIKTVLAEPYKLVISVSAAKRIFGDDDPIDKNILIGTDKHPYTVSGLMEDIPENCHFEANMISSFMTNERSREGIWFNNSFETYLMLYPGTDSKLLEEKFPRFVKEYVGGEYERFSGGSFEELLSSGAKYDYLLQPLTKIHLDPSIDQPMKPASDPKYLIIFACVALLIIIIASINFTNLSTAQAAQRSKEVGLKKVSGSSRAMLLYQFLTESILLSLFALVIAVFIVKLALPAFNNLLNASFGLSLFGNWYTILILIAAALFVGVIAGSYPAFYLSSISPFSIFKGNNSKLSAGGRLRSILVVFQFAASIILIVGTTIMYRQINYMLNKDVGYNKENLLVITRAGDLDTRVEAFKTVVKDIPGVINIAAATAVPNKNNNHNGYKVEGKDESILLFTSWVDYDHLDIYQMEMLEGRFFSKDFPADVDACIINEAAVNENNISDPLSARIIHNDNDGAYTYLPVIGVVKDFNHESLRNKVQPYIMRFRTAGYQFGYLSIRLSPEGMQETVAQIEEAWKEFTNTDTMPYFFMEDELNSIYREDRRSATLTIIFAVFALFVASLGLFGLTSFMLQQRTKEIGIRKVMGASISIIFKLITKDILLLVTLAALIASPLIYIIAQRWLEGYFFRIQIGISEFIIGYALALSIAFFTISYRTVITARASPINSLRYE